MNRHSNTLLIIFGAFGALWILLIVGLAIALVAFGLSPMLVDFDGVGDTVETDAAMGSVSVSLEFYRLDVGEYPSSELGLQALCECPSDLPDPSRWQGPYLSPDVPADAWGGQLRYSSDSTSAWILTSAGPDRQFDTDDDICDKGPKGPQRPEF